MLGGGAVLAVVAACEWGSEGGGRVGGRGGARGGVWSMDISTCKGGGGLKQALKIDFIRVALVRTARVAGTGVRGVAHGQQHL